MQNNFTWSWSALEAYEQCPRKYYHGYILREKEPPNEHLIRGRAVHKQHEDYLMYRTKVAPSKYAEAVKRQAKGQDLRVEAKLGLNGQLEGTGFFDDRVWGRSAIDVIITNYTTGVIIDWKTGKNKEGGKFDTGPHQLKIMALFAFKHFPKIESVTTMNIYLDADQIGQTHQFRRDDEAKLWSEIMPRIERMERAVTTQQFPVMPGALCGYCPVKSCPNNRS
jgi:hypothetical protein